MTVLGSATRLADLLDSVRDELTARRVEDWRRATPAVESVFRVLVDAAAPYAAGRLLEAARSLELPDPLEIRVLCGQLACRLAPDGRYPLARAHEDLSQAPPHHSCGAAVAAVLAPMLDPWLSPERGGIGGALPSMKVLDAQVLCAIVLTDADAAYPEVVATQGRWRS